MKKHEAPINKFEKYRKRAIVIDAQQWFPSKEIPCVKSEKNYENLSILHYIDSPTGKQTVGYGDWIICGVEGEYYVCSDSVFKKTYDKFDSESKSGLTDAMCNDLQNLFTLRDKKLAYPDYINQNELNYLRAFEKFLQKWGYL